MGKTSKWFRSLLGSKKSLPESSPATSSPPAGNKKKKSKWCLVKLSNTSNQRSILESHLKNDTNSSANPYVETLDANKHAIAVAAATAAVAEAALAAAQAAAEVVRLTSGDASSRSAPAYVNHGGSDRRRVLAAVKIQSEFRAYLARRALRALKGLVKLQALVRGRIVRKQSAHMLHRMQAMARIQARACAHRAHVSESSNLGIKFSGSLRPGMTNHRNYERQSSSAKYNSPIVKKSGSRSHISSNMNTGSLKLGSNWLDHWMEECAWNNYKDTSLKTGCGDDERSDKVLEIDTWKPSLNSRRSDRTLQTSQRTLVCNENGQEYTKSNSSFSRNSGKLQKPNPSISSEEISSLRSVKFCDQASARTAENSPTINSASSRPSSSRSRRGTFTPARSEYSRSKVGDYFGHPNYMTNTESFQAKVRSQSAPRQRMQFEDHVMNRKFGRGPWDFDTNSEKGPTLSTNYKSRTYLYSGQVNRQRTPIRGAALGFSSSYGYGP
ncbi:IQ-domain 24 [Forsythia ovata]|uniref:IQ-domain 24 n=1 Tax=Forsythia ovata TaxID=205694 RepID=A0ABD1WL00_9LAMI